MRIEAQPGSFSLSIVPVWVQKKWLKPALVEERYKLVYAVDRPLVALQKQLFLNWAGRCLFPPSNFRFLPKVPFLG